MGGAGNEYIGQQFNKKSQSSNRVGSVLLSDASISAQEEPSPIDVLEMRLFILNAYRKLYKIMEDLRSLHLLPRHCCFSDILYVPERAEEKGEFPYLRALSKTNDTGDEEMLIRQFIDIIRITGRDYLDIKKKTIANAVEKIVQLGENRERVDIAYMGILVNSGYKPLVGNEITIDDVRHVQRMPDVIIAAMTDYLPEDTAEQLITWRQEQAKLRSQDKPEANFG